MKISGIKAAGLAKIIGSRAPEIEADAGSDTVTRRPEGLEFTRTLYAKTGQIRLTLNETEMRDWHMRLGRALGMGAP